MVYQSPFTAVVQVQAPAQTELYVSWLFCRVSRGFLWVLQFSSLPKNQHVNWVLYVVNIEYNGSVYFGANVMEEPCTGSDGGCKI